MNLSRKGGLFLEEEEKIEEKNMKKILSRSDSWKSDAAAMKKSR